MVSSCSWLCGDHYLAGGSVYDVAAFGYVSFSTTSPADGQIVVGGNGESLHLIGKVLNHRDVSPTAIYARLN